MQMQDQKKEISLVRQHEVHHQSPFQNYFKEVIYGGIDGIVTTFVIVAGFSGATFANETTTQLSFLIVLLFGLANLFADATSMGLGNFLSVKSNKDLYKVARATEEGKIQNDFQYRFDESVAILIAKGYSDTDAQELVTLYAKNPLYWLDCMMVHELKMGDPRNDNPIFTGLATFSAFLVFGMIPLLPFIFFSSLHQNTVFLYSIFGTGFALILLGLLKWRIVGSKLLPSLFEVLAVGGSAATIAFVVGSFFRV